MIPKIIHYCWLSNDPYPELIEKCISTWKKILPDYIFIKWDRSMPTFNVPWVRESYDAKKYAFAADYIRLYALYNYGGIYLDSDVEVLKSFNDLLHLPYFWSAESAFDSYDAENDMTYLRFDKYIDCGIMGAEPGNPLIKDVMQWYENNSFKAMYEESCKLSNNPMEEIFLFNYTIPNIIYNLTESHGINRISVDNLSYIMDNNLYILTPCWFSPIIAKKDKSIWHDHSNENTHAIHHFTGSWLK